MQKTWVERLCPGAELVVENLGFCSLGVPGFLVAEWDNITHYKTESVHFLAFMNSATKASGPRGTCSPLSELKACAATCQAVESLFPKPLNPKP